ncbi:MAG: hypothetical protein M0P66_06335, partial [Salinivirgaceae bacterium]|nr:hypothetical protein [Salinivirgaceae bacterium]
LSPAKKKIRKRGEIVYLKDKAGNRILDKNGQLIPMYAEGDCIRGQLHQETFFGAIKLPLKNEDGSFKIENSKFVYDDKLTFVVREPFVYKKDTNSPGFKSLEEIGSCIVDKHLFEMIKKHIGDKDFKTAMNDGIYLYNKKGEKAGKIRHIRIFVRATEPLKIKEQTYVSNKSTFHIQNREYKKYYYAGNGENYAYALYQGIIKNKTERSFKIINLIDTANIVKISPDRKLSIEPVIECKKEKLQLYAIFQIGQKVIFFKNNPEELYDFTNTELSKRMYKILGFEKDGRIRFWHHIDGRDERQLKELESVYGKGIWQGFSTINFEQPWPKLKLTTGNFNFLIENKDFTIAPDGQIKFLK